MQATLRRLQGRTSQWGQGRILAGLGRLCVERPTQMDKAQLSVGAEVCNTPSDYLVEGIKMT